MTKKGAPSKVVWSPSADLAFKSLIGASCERPILPLPDFDRDFIQRTDALEFGHGTVLSQEHTGVNVFLVREMVCSVIGKCLGNTNV